MKKYTITLREFNGTNFVELISPSLGATLFASDDRAKAVEEYNRFSCMNSRQMLDHLHGNK